MGCDAMDRTRRILADERTVRAHLGAEALVRAVQHRAGRQKPAFDHPAEGDAGFGAFRFRHLDRIVVRRLDRGDARARDTGVIPVALDADKPAAEPRRHGARRARAEEGIEHHIAGPGRGDHHAMEQGFRLLRRMRFFAVFVLQALVSGAGDAAYRFMTGDENAAGEAFQNLFQRFPKAINVHFLYGYLLFSTDPDAALAEFQQELQIAPTNVDADVMAAWALLLRSRGAEALPLAQRAVDENPSLPSAQLVLGRSLMETGELKDALAHLEKALQMEPDNLETHLALAKAYSKSGRKEDARRERIRCLQLTSSKDTTIGQP